MTDSPDGTSLPPLSALRRGEGTPIVLVHGFTQSHRSWDAIAAELQAAGHEVVTPDLPGHGESPFATGDLWSAAEQLGAACGRGTYVGYSLGGRICLHLALSRPDLVRGLVLVSTTAGIEDVLEREDRGVADEALATRLDDGEDEGLPAFLDEWLAGPLFAGLSEEAADKPARLVNHASGLASSLRAHGAGTQLPLWERLHEIEVPVVVMAGAEDAKFADLGSRLATAIGTNALFVLVPEAGHAAPFELPDAFARLVADFVEGQLPADAPPVEPGAPDVAATGDPAAAGSPAGAESPAGAGGPEAP